MFDGPLHSLIPEKARARILAHVAHAFLLHWAVTFLRGLSSRRGGVHPNKCVQVKKEGSTGIFTLAVVDAKTLWG